MDKALIEYFIEKTDAQLLRLEGYIDKRFDETNAKIEPLYKFRWQFAGGITVLNTILGIVIAIYFGR